MKIKLLFVFILLCSTANSQKIQWAKKLIGFSSQTSTVQFSARQVLAKPSVSPNFGLSACAWMPDKNSTKSEEWIHVEFKDSMQINQVTIAENCSSGLIKGIMLYDTKGKNYVVYNNAYPEVKENRREFLNIKFPKTDYFVKSVAVYISKPPKNVIYQIDALAISDTLEDIKPQINLASEEQVSFEIENLGSKINTYAAELLPIISSDGKRLFFTRDNYHDNIGTQKKEDIWYSDKDSAGNFQKAKNIGPPINNNNTNFAISVTQDGNALIIGNIYYKDGSMAPGISISNNLGDSIWSFPKKLINNTNININKHIGYYLTPNGKYLIISAEYEDSYGGLDLYISHLNKDGTISKPVNLGPDINTAGNEISPFLASDGKTLYYSTNGLPGYGENDLFISRVLDSNYTRWEEPKNLGRPINTSDWDAYYTIPASGDYAYFVSTRSGYGGEDIFRVKLSESIKPKTVVLVKGKVINKKNNEPVESKIVYETLADGNEAGVAQSNAKTGDYQIVLPAGTKYAFLALADGYVSVNENIDLTEIDKYSELSRDLFLVPVEEGQTIVMNNIFFEFDKFNLLPESFPELNRIVSFLIENPKVKIEISGHTDNVGSPQHNKILSQNRAQAVFNYFLSKKIEKTRLTIKGYGSAKPIMPNDNDDNRAKNRRVEFEIKSK